MVKGNRFLLISVAFVAIVFLTAALLPRERNHDNQDPMRWDLGGGLTASFSDDGRHGYVLAIEGEGDLGGFASPKDAPWYARSGRVSKIVLSEGIVSVGGGAFAACEHVDAVVLPRSTASLGAEAFAAGTRVFAYGQIAAPEEVCIYQYSENQPEQGGYYWHMESGEATVWGTTKVLFIGNSFTYTFDIATWGFPKQANGRTIPEMESALREAYASVAKELGVKVSNVGAAFTAVYQNHPEINLYSGDQQHPSYAGAYLSACVHAATLLGIDPGESGFDGYPLPDNPHPDDAIYANDVTFDAQTAELLRDAACSTVFGTKK